MRQARLLLQQRPEQRIGLRILPERQLRPAENQTDQRPILVGIAQERRDLGFRPGGFA